jgi:hypothetical protein
MDDPAESMAEEIKMSLGMNVLTGLVPAANISTTWETPAPVSLRQ